MGRKEASLNTLEQFLPSGTYSMVAVFFSKYNIHLSIKRDRVTVLGDYRAPTRDYPAHRISVNGSLNPYSFLVTLLHELAHMLAFVRYRFSIRPHGPEWKEIFGHLLRDYLGKGIFPADIEQALSNYQSNMTASTCSDPALYRALKMYDRRRDQVCMVEELALHAHFVTRDGRVFQKMEKLRTRFRCREVKTGHMYLFPALAEVRSLAAVNG